MADKSKVIKYMASWNAGSNLGEIKLKLENGDVKTWDGPEAGEFCALLQILKGDVDPYFSSDGWLTTGPEDPGDW